MAQVFFLRLDTLVRSGTYKCKAFVCPYWKWIGMKLVAINNGNWNNIGSSSSTRTTVNLNNLILEETLKPDMVRESPTYSDWKIYYHHARHVKLVIIKIVLHITFHILHYGDGNTPFRSFWVTTESHKEIWLTTWTIKSN